MTWTFEQLRNKYPAEADAEIQEALELLNRNPARLRDIIHGEDQMPDASLELGDDGLTASQRALNEFAEQNALPVPFTSE